MSSNKHAEPSKNYKSPSSLPPSPSPKRQRHLHRTHLNSNSRFSKNPPFPPYFQRGESKVSLCKGRFRGIFNLFNTTLTEPCLRLQVMIRFGQDHRFSGSKNPSLSNSATRLESAKSEGFLPFSSGIEGLISSIEASKTSLMG
jgi:hypothetical protein